LAQLAKKRTALGLYLLLLVLPTFVLGGLHWRQLAHEQSLELAEIPILAEDSRGRLISGIRARLVSLLDAEGTREFSEYQRQVYPEELLGSELAFVPSDLTQSPAPDGILGWFAWDFNQALHAPYELFGGALEGWEEWEDRSEDLAFAVEDLIVNDWLDGFPTRATRYEIVSEPYRVPLSVLVVNMSKEKDFDCLSRERHTLIELESEFVDVHQFDFHVRFYLENDGTPRLIATRTVLVDGIPDLHKMPSCYSNLAEGATLVQGFFIDPQWLFSELPMEIAAQVLREPEVLHSSGTPSLVTNANHVVEKLYLVDELGFETYDPGDSSFGELQISVGSEGLTLRHNRQTRWFLAVATMLLLSLSTGIVLLLRSVKQELAQARQTENFVAAITHELRTPVSAIRLYGEMLRDGWAPSEKKRAEYYGRIVQEAHRLETMVERVLEKSQVASGKAKPQAGDINQFISGIVSRQWKLTKGLQVDLDPQMPRVMMIPEAVRSIVINLVENAFKYAPPRKGGTEDEEVLLRTIFTGGIASLEVLDRGPGIPEEERQSVFEAFYRLGDEATRKSKGTGLGLHLVKIQSQAIGGNVEILDRTGGGAYFRVTLKVAPVG
jgi:signal transduction histidine kinase